MPPNCALITAKLLELNRLIAPEVLLPALCDEAIDLVQSDPYAFCLATCLDRGMNADVVWTFPYWIKRDLGHLDPFRIARMSLDELDAMLRRLPKRPRYINAAPRTIHEISHIVAREFGGKAERIWQGRPAWEVQRTFESVHGVGPGIASMALQLIEKGFGYHFSDEDHRHMDIKPDVHTVRVLYRLGMGDAPTVEQALASARELHPEYPGELDGALWHIGRTWCTAQAPSCGACHMGEVCVRRLTPGAKAPG
jgi:endonuclease III